MLEEIKKALLVEYKSELVNLEEEKNKLLIEKDNLDKDRIDLVRRSNNVYKEEECVKFNNDYSKLSKAFNKKKYIDKRTELYESVKDKLTNKANNELKEIESIKKRIKDIEERVSVISNELKNIDNIKDISELSISYDDVKKLLSRNGINIFKYSKSDILKLGSSVETTNNPIFMMKAVKENPFNIIYDECNSIGMYYTFIKELKFKGNNQEEIDSFNKNRDSLLDLINKSNSGSIHIKPEYIMEAIRFYFKDTIMYENGKLRDGTENDLFKAVSYINQVIMKALELSQEDYYKLMGMYNPKDNDYYCHRTGVLGVEDSIMSNGLCISKQGSDPKRVIVRTARKVDCFLAMAGYCNFYAGNGAGESRIILEIPKDCERPIGSDTMDGKNTVVLPEYVMASLYEKPILNNEGTVIKYDKPVLHINNQNKKTYRYLYKDGYDENMPLPIENSELVRTGVSK